MSLYGAFAPYARSYHALGYHALSYHALEARKLLLCKSVTESHLHSMSLYGAIVPLGRMEIS